MPTGLLYLAALILNFVKQTDVFNGDHCLVRKCHCQLNLPAGKGPHRLSDQNYNANRNPFAQERYTCDRACPHFLYSLAEHVLWIVEDVHDLDDVSLDSCATGYTAPTGSELEFLHVLVDLGGEPTTRCVAIR